MPYKDPEVAKAKRREHYLKNKGRILARIRTYYEKNKEKCEERKRKWQKKNRGKVLAYSAKWRATHPEENKQRISGYKERLRVQVFQHYGNRCACCGDTHREFFAMDHIEGGGNAHRRKEKIRGSGDLFLWIIRHNFPISFRILCHNCNMARGFHGYCPHERERLVTDSPTHAPL